MVLTIRLEQITLKCIKLSKKGTCLRSGEHFPKSLILWVSGKKESQPHQAGVLISTSKSDSIYDTPTCKLSMLGIK